MPKETLDTLKKFIKLHESKLLICVLWTSGGWADYKNVKPNHFEPIVKVNSNKENSLGISGLWLVNRERDSFASYETEFLKGIRVVNSCTSFIVAIKK